MADISRAEVARLEKKAANFENERSHQKAVSRGWGNLIALEASSFLTGYARGRVGDGDKLQIGAFPVPLDLVGAAAGIAFGLRKGKFSGMSTSIGAGMLSSFLSHEGNKIGMRAKSRGNLIGASYPSLASAPQGLIGNAQYNIVGAAGTGMGQGAVSNYARNAW